MNVLNRRLSWRTGRFRLNLSGKSGGQRGGIRNIPKVRIISLSEESYKDLSEIKKTLGLDFDDAYQYKICMENNLKMATMDSDFKKAGHKIEVMFL